MKYGMNLLLWTDEPADEKHLPLYGRLREMGFDGLELPIFGGEPDQFARLGLHLDDLGFERTVTAICNAEEDPISPDPAVRRAAVRAMKKTIDCADAAGAKLIGGPLYAAIGQFSGEPPTSDEWKRSVECMRESAEYAADAGITLVFEFLNRFEIYLLNCAEDTARFVRDIDHPNVGVHYDTFHANIEEKDVRKAITGAAREIRHVHISENDRGTPGQGQVRWAETFDALKEIDYAGWLVIEAFGSALPGIAAATKIWRRMFESEEQLARDGLAFMRSEWAKRTS